MAFIVSVGEPFLFGIVEKKPELPFGFSYVQHPEKYLLATNGRRIYFVRRTDLVLQRTAREKDAVRTKGRLKVGRPFCDRRVTIRIQLAFD